MALVYRVGRQACARLGVSCSAIRPSLRGSRNVTVATSAVQSMRCGLATAAAPVTAPRSVSLLPWQRVAVTPMLPLLRSQVSSVRVIKRSDASFGVGVIRRSMSSSSTSSAASATATATAKSSTATAATTAAPRVVGYWLLGCSGLVFGMVVLGGVTRLTESGLSMVRWRFLGTAPPRSEAEWQDLFQDYQQYPEYQQLNKGMTLAEFKRIFWFEYSHRMLGRVIGLSVLVPYVGFWARGMLPRHTKVYVGAVLGAIVAQGLVGWYMVRSGLQDKRQHGDNSVPRVSQYRLAAHFSSAVGIYAALLWKSFEILLPRAPSAVPTSFRRLAVLTTGVAAATALSGAFVAGLDAGLVYNEYPNMGHGLVPEDINVLQPWYRNITENASTAQFDHRVLGHTTVALSLATMIASRRHASLSKASRIAAAHVGVFALAQASLGIATLLMFVPVPLAACHQAGSLTVLGSAVWLLHELRRFPRVPL